MEPGEQYEGITGDGGKPVSDEELLAGLATSRRRAGACRRRVLIGEHGRAPLHPSRRHQP